MNKQTITIEKPKRLRGEVTIPGDKSISHRSIIFGALAKGDTRVKGFLDAADCRATISLFRMLGITIENDGQETLVIRGKGAHGLKAPTNILDVNNSGTTMRLSSGILAGQPFSSKITGDASIQKRPMGRIMEPLLQMGANIVSENGNNLAPLVIKPAELSGIHYHSPIASAQVKSCILLAGLYASGETTVTEPIVSRDHTERMLKAFGADIHAANNSVSIRAGHELMAQDIDVPADISSAAYFLAAASIHPDAELLLKGVNINPTRVGILTVAKGMGANISLENKRMVSGEEVADLIIRSASLQGTVIDGDLIPTLIDELPVIAVMAAFAKGQTIIRDAAELRVKESDRIETVCSNLLEMGARVTPKEDGMVIEGGQPLKGAHIKTVGDHRIAMAFSVAGLMTGEQTFDDTDCVQISYENFYDSLFSVMEM